MRTVVRLCRDDELNWYWVFICAGLTALLMVSILDDGLVRDFTVYLLFTFLFLVMVAYQGFEIILGK